MEGNSSSARIGLHNAELNLRRTRRSSCPQGPDEEIASLGPESIERNKLGVKLKRMLCSLRPSPRTDGQQDQPHGVQAPGGGSRRRFPVPSCDVLRHQTPIRAFVPREGGIELRGNYPGKQRLACLHAFVLIRSHRGVSPLWPEASFVMVSVLTKGMSSLRGLPPLVS